MENQYQALGLIFEAPDMAPAQAQIYVQTFSSRTPTGFDGPVFTLAPSEYGPDEFDRHADQLIENINRLKKEAREQFIAAKKVRATS